MQNLVLPNNSQGLYLTKDVGDQYLQAERAKITVTDDCVRSPMIQGLMSRVSEGPDGLTRATSTQTCF